MFFVHHEMELSLHRKRDTPLACGSLISLLSHLEHAKLTQTQSSISSFVSDWLTIRSIRLRERKSFQSRRVEEVISRQRESVTWAISAQRRGSTTNAGRANPKHKPTKNCIAMELCWPFVNVLRIPALSIDRNAMQLSMSSYANSRLAHLLATVRL